MQVRATFDTSWSLDYVTSVDLWSDLIAMDYPSPYILRLYIALFMKEKDRKMPKIITWPVLGIHPEEDGLYIYMLN